MKVYEVVRVADTLNLSQGFYASAERAKARKAELEKHASTVAFQEAMLGLGLIYISHHINAHEVQE